jgi:hypothetical protein
MRKAGLILGLGVAGLLTLQLVGVLGLDTGPVVSVSFGIIIDFLILVGAILATSSPRAAAASFGGAFELCFKAMCGRAQAILVPRVSI